MSPATIHGWRAWWFAICHPVRTRRFFVACNSEVPWA